MPIGILCSLPVGARMLATRHRAASALFRPLRMLCTDGKKAVTTTEDPGDAVAEPLKNERGEVVKTWGSSVELPAVTKKEAEKAFLEATDFKTAMTPPIQTAVAARDDMLKDRFNYVSTNLNPASQYIVMGGKGAVAPAAIGQGSFIIAGICVLLSGIAGVVYIKTQWKVNSALELGDRLRAKGAERKELLERSNSAKLVRSVSANAEASVKEHVELVRRPSQQLGAHLDTSFKGVVKEGRTTPGSAAGLGTKDMEARRAAAAATPAAE